MKNTTIQTSMAKSLSAILGTSITYNAVHNVFLSKGYTSAAGNMYYKAAHINEKLVICYELGQGYKYTFLNGIKIFCWDGKKAFLAAQENWGGSNWKKFSEKFAMEQSVLMLKKFMAGNLKMKGVNVSNRVMYLVARELIKDVHRKRLA